MERDVGNSSERWGGYAKEFVRAKRGADISDYYSKYVTGIIMPLICSERVTFVDVAAGAGALTFNLLEALDNSGRSLCPGSRVIVTDFAEALVKASEKRISSLRCLHDWGWNPEFQVMDALHPTIPAGTVTHMGCMFGIMFVPQYQVAMKRLCECLVPNGFALFATWKYSQIVDLFTDFGVFVGASAAEIESSVEASPIVICKDPDLFKRDLEEAGFVNINVDQHEAVMPIAHDDASMSKFLKNPVIREAFRYLKEHTDERIIAEWNNFLIDERGCKWLTSDGQFIDLRVCANIATAYRAAI